MAISEVMFDACGDPELDITDEFVEIYNFGTVPVNLETLWITNGHPQKIVPWLVENPFTPFFGTPIENQNTWILPPNTFGLILAPDYIYGDRPYLIPPETEIFTVSRSTGGRLGWPNGYIGSLNSIEARDVIILYSGTSEYIDVLVSTYGTPKLTSNPKNVSDDNNDELPIYQGDCFSVERIFLAGDDNILNWKRIYGGSPGTISGQYIPIPSATTTATLTITPTIISKPSSTMVPASETPTIFPTPTVSPTPTLKERIRVNLVSPEVLAAIVTGIVGIISLFLSARLRKSNAVPPSQDHSS